MVLDHGVDDFVKKGTLGATFDEVQEGINQALNLDCNMIIAIGEVATNLKNVSIIYELNNHMFNYFF